MQAPVPVVRQLAALLAVLVGALVLLAPWTCAQACAAGGDGCEPALLLLAPR